MKNILILLSIIVLVGCKSKYEKNLSIMEANYKQSLIDDAFRNNQKLTIFTLKAIRYDTINENSIDTIRLIRLSLRRNNLIDLVVSQTNSLETEKDIMNLTDDPVLHSFYREKIKESLKESQPQVDTIEMLKLKDSIIKQRILSKRNHVRYFRLKIFEKSTLKKDTISENCMDTIFIYFDKNLKLFPINY